MIKDHIFSTRVSMMAFFFIIISDVEGGHCKVGGDTNSKAKTKIIISFLFYMTLREV